MMSQPDNPIEQLLKEASHLYGVGAEIAEKVGLVQGLWAQAEFDRHVYDDGIECADNFRWCRVGVKDEEDTFNRHAAEGCCGVYYWTVVDPDGQMWQFGFNHGH